MVWRPETGKEFQEDEQTRKDLSKEGVLYNGVEISIGWVQVFKEWMREHRVGSSEL